MMLLDILIQTVTDWIRDILVEILGRRTEDFFGRRLKRKGRLAKRAQRQRLRKRATAKRGQ
jgi:hypothetical protein